MKNQKKAVFVLGGIAAVVVVIFIAGISTDTQEQPSSAEEFEPQEYPVFGLLSDLLGHFAPQLEFSEIRPLALPRSFRIFSSQDDHDLRKARFCISPLSGNDSAAMAVIEYRASRADSEFENLEIQICTVSVRNTERFPSCCNIMALRSSGVVSFKSLRGRMAISLRNEELLRLE